MKFCLGHPPVNPINGKAQALPIINPFDRHGRVFFFSWLAFMLSFLSWYAFPPLLSHSIKADLHLTTPQVLNSNIVALVAGFCMRFIVGPLCDAFGPRKVMIAILACAAIPTGLAGTISTVNGLYAIRFFVGIAGAAFVPCQAWCTNWYDKGVVGTANAFAAGWGNSGGGITYFVMPAVFDSLVHSRGLTSHVAWRVSFIVPCILLLATAAAILLTCEDTPNGKWADRHLQHSGTSPSSKETVDRASNTSMDNEKKVEGTASVQPAPTPEEEIERDPKNTTPIIEVVEKPNLKTALKGLLCMQTLMLAAPYFCTFGGELSINSILSAWYLQHNPRWTQTKAGQWAAMFGLLNVVTRPLGGFASDWIYRIVGPKRGVHAKKFWYGFLCFMQGVFCLWVGLINPKSHATLIGGVAGIAIFMDAANGAAFSLVPHVNPHINGIMSGTVGACGNLGGVVFSVIFRFVPYNKGIWIIGIFSMIIGAAITLIKPIPKAQRGAGGYMST